MIVSKKFEIKNIKYSQKHWDKPNKRSSVDKAFPFMNFTKKSNTKNFLVNKYVNFTNLEILHFIILNIKVYYSHFLDLFSLAYDLSIRFLLH